MPRAGTSCGHRTRTSRSDRECMGTRRTWASVGCHPLATPSAQRFMLGNVNRGITTSHLPKAERSRRSLQCGTLVCEHLRKPMPIRSLFLSSPRPRCSWPSHALSTFGLALNPCLTASSLPVNGTTPHVSPASQLDSHLHAHHRPARSRAHRLCQARRRAALLCLRRYRRHPLRHRYAPLVAARNLGAELTPTGYPWFGDEMESLINATNKWTGHEEAAGAAHPGKWSAISANRVSEALAKADYLRESRDNPNAWNTYRRWIEGGAQQASVRRKSSGKGYIVEWAVNFNPAWKWNPASSTRSPWVTGT